GVVLLVMMGKQAQEMQLAHWISRTVIPWLVNALPTRIGMWFAVDQSYETLIAQGLAPPQRVGSYYAARRFGGGAVLTSWPDTVLTSALIDQVAAQIMNGSERLRLEFANSGSCDCSYAIENLARFRVNIFKQNGRHAIVMRKLQSNVPTLEKLALSPIFREIV